MTEVSATAADAVRKDFNPSNSSDVAEIKKRTAELVAIMEVIRDRDDGLAGREAAVAITNLQTASMWCVLAATKAIATATKANPAEFQNSTKAKYKDGTPYEGGKPLGS